MGPIIGRALAAGVSALAKRAAKKAAEEEGKRAGPSVAGIAAESSKRSGRNMADEMIEAERKMQTKRDLDVAKANPARKAAEDAAEVTTKDGVKTTSYPYVKPTPENMKKGGAVTRGDGCAQRGKTKGRMI